MLSESFTEAVRKTLYDTHEKIVRQHEYWVRNFGARREPPRVANSREVLRLLDSISALEWKITSLEDRIATMVTLEQVRDAVEEVVAEHGKPSWYDSQLEFVDDIMDRLPEGGTTPSIDSAQVDNPDIHDKRIIAAATAAAWETVYHYQRLGMQPTEEDVRNGMNERLGSKA